MSALAPTFLGLVAQCERMMRRYGITREQASSWQFARSHIKALEAQLAAVNAQIAALTKGGA